MLNPSDGSSEPLVLNRIAVSGHYDVAKQRFAIDEGDVGNTGVGVAMSGNVDFSGGNVRVAAGLAGTRMPVDALKRLWPVFIQPKVRDWFNEHLLSGTLERIVIAVNAPLDTLRDGGPPVPDDGLSIDALATGCVVRPVDGLPALRDADMNVHVVGRDAVVSIGKANRRHALGTQARFHLRRIRGARHGAARAAGTRSLQDGRAGAGGGRELLRMDRLRDVSDAPFEPSTMRGNLSAQVTLGMPLKADLPPGSTNYAISIETTNFSAERMIMGQKVEAAVLRANANPQGFQLKGDVKIAGAPMSLEYRKSRGEADAEVRLQGMLDETARSNLGFEMGEALSGSIPIRLAGRVATGSDREGRFNIEADLTSAQIDGLSPGWAKQSGKPARATFVLTTKPQSIRVEDLLIEGAGAGVKGTIDFDGSGEVQSANFPSYGFSDGDRASLKIERGAEGALRVILRGEVYDGRGFVKSAAGGAPANSTAKRRSVDADLDMKVAAVVGYNGEALRGVELKMSRRAGEVRSFGLNAKIGRDATLAGDLRGRSSGRQMVYLESSDAGAFFRFTDVYSRMTGGQLAMTMEAPSADNQTQQGILNVRNFAVHDEAQLERAVNNGTQARRNAIDFSGMRVEFTRMPAKCRCATVWCVDRSLAAPSTASSITDATRCTCAAPWCRSTGRTICSASCRWSDCSWAARRKACSGSLTKWSADRAIRCCADQSDFSAGSRPVAQGVRIPGQWRHRQRRIADPAALGRSDDLRFGGFPIGGKSNSTLIFGDRRWTVTLFGTISGNGSRALCPAEPRASAGLARITVGSWMHCCGWRAPAAAGAICPNGSATIIR